MACNKCNRTRCECNKCVSATPTPFYDKSCICEEDNCEKIYIQEAALGLRIESSWNIPQCGGAAFLTVPNVSQIPVGEYIHHPTYGYFLINSFDALNRTLSISNPCFVDNAPVGTEVPPCTVFTVVPPPCCQSDTGGCDFLAVSFTAPEEDVPLNITLTSVLNLVAGNNVQIGSGIYFLSAILADNIITIINQGDGAIPGTPVIADDISGKPQYCVELLTVNPCSRAVVANGVAICCLDSQIQPVTGTTNGFVWTLTDSTNGSSIFADSGVAAVAAKIAAMATDEQNGSTAQVTPGTNLNFASPTITTAAVGLTVTNAHTTDTMKVMFNMQAHTVGIGDGTQPFTLTMELNLDTGGGPNIVKTTVADLLALGAFGGEANYFVAVAIPPATSITYQISVTVTIAGANGMSYTTDDIQGFISVLGVVV